MFVIDDFTTVCSHNPTFVLHHHEFERGMECDSSVGQALPAAQQIFIYLCIRRSRRAYPGVLVFASFEMHHFGCGALYVVIAGPMRAIGSQ